MGVAALVLVLARVLVVETFAVVSDSMAPTLRAGDRLVVLKTTTLERGDVIVFDGEHLLGTQDLDRGVATVTLERLLGADPTTAYVKRVIGVPGDQVACCDDDGHLVVNGDALAEPYLDGPTDQVTFEVTVPADRYWVLGDNRADSADSRSALGRPGGGMLRAGDVIGEVTWRYWPADRVGGVRGAGAAHTIPQPRAMPVVSATWGILSQDPTGTPTSRDVTDHGTIDHGTTDHGTTHGSREEQA